MNKCFQRVLFRILLMVPLWTPYVFAISLSDSSNISIRSRITGMSDSLSLECLFALPFTPRQRPLPFFSLSFELSWYEPKNRCDGLQQDGLSQVCNTHILGSSVGFWIKKAIRCASQSLLRNISRPYGAFLSLYLFQFQQTFGFPTSTFSQNRDISFSVKTIDGGTESDVDRASSITPASFAIRAIESSGGCGFSFL